MTSDYVIVSIKFCSEFGNQITTSLHVILIAVDVMKGASETGGGAPETAPPPPPNLLGCTL